MSVADSRNLRLPSAKQRTIHREAAPYAARRLAAYMRSAETQRWLTEFGKGELDSRPLFFPVVVPEQVAAPAGGKTD
jgi:hypothetical protein